MAALPPATVILNGLRRTLSLFGIRDDVKTEGMKRLPTAKTSAFPKIEQVANEKRLTFDKLRVITEERARNKSRCGGQSKQKQRKGSDCSAHGPHTW